MHERVNVINRTIGGRYFLEGRPRVIRDLGGDLALVDFDDGCGALQRFVDPNAQGTDIDDYVAGLNAPANGEAA